MWVWIPTANTSGPNDNLLSLTTLADMISARNWQVHYQKYQAQTDRAKRDGTDSTSLRQPTREDSFEVKDASPVPGDWGRAAVKRICHMRESQGLGIRVEVPKTIWVVPCSLGNASAMPSDRGRARPLPSEERTPYTVLITSTESQDQDLASTVLNVAHSLDSGMCRAIAVNVGRVWSWSCELFKTFKML